MTTLPIGQWTPLRLPTRAEVRLMLMQPRVIIALVVSVTLVLLALIGGVVFLAYTGKSTEALTMSIAAPLIGLLVAQGNRIRNIDRQVTELKGQTNGQG